MFLDPTFWLIRHHSKLGHAIRVEAVYFFYIIMVCLPKTGIYGMDE